MPTTGGSMPLDVWKLIPNLAVVVRTLRTAALCRANSDHCGHYAGHLHSRSHLNLFLCDTWYYIIPPHVD